MLSGFAAQPRVPTARHSGAHTFGRRGETFWMKTSIQRLEKSSAVRPFEVRWPGILRKGLSEPPSLSSAPEEPKDSFTQRQRKPLGSESRRCRTSLKARVALHEHCQCQDAKPGPKLRLIDDGAGE